MLYLIVLLFVCCLVVLFALLSALALGALRPLGVKVLLEGELPPDDDLELLHVADQLPLELLAVGHLVLDDGDPPGIFWEYVL